MPASITLSETVDVAELRLIPASITLFETFEDDVAELRVMPASITLPVTDDLLLNLSDDFCDCTCCVLDLADDCLGESVTASPFLLRSGELG